MRALVAAAALATLVAMAPVHDSDAAVAARRQDGLEGFHLGRDPVPHQADEDRPRRDVFDAPTPTLDSFMPRHTLNPGENTAVHRHPQEELVVVKEGTLEINIDGKKQIAGPGSMIFYAANENENMTNVGKTPATTTSCSGSPRSRPRGRRRRWRRRARKRGLAPFSGR